MEREVLQDSTLSLHNRLNTSNRDEELHAVSNGKGDDYFVKENIQGQVSAKHIGRRSAHVKNYSGSNHSYSSKSATLMRPT
jgi:hypothetical protein